MQMLSQVKAHKLTGPWPHVGHDKYIIERTVITGFIEGARKRIRQHLAQPSHYMVEPLRIQSSEYSLE